VLRNVPRRNLKLDSDASACALRCDYSAVPLALEVDALRDAEIVDRRHRDDCTGRARVARGSIGRGRFLLGASFDSKKRETVKRLYDSGGERSQRVILAILSNPTLQCLVILGV
jgi:hypothetical protein